MFIITSECFVFTISDFLYYTDYLSYLKLDSSCDFKMNAAIELVNFINDMEVIDDDDELDVLELIEYGVPRQIYERADYFNQMDNATFRKRFRLSKEAVQQLLLRIEDRLHFPYDL